MHIAIRPVLGIVLRMPEVTRDRTAREQAYFRADTVRTAAYLGLPHCYPDPSPIAFEPGSLWVASEEQPRVERLNRLFVGAVREGAGMPFLDHVMRGLWDGTNPGWDRSDFLDTALQRFGYREQELLARHPWEEVSAELSANHQAMLAAGHWGVPLMVFEGEPFYGQDRFDQLLWRMGQPPL